MKISSLQVAVTMWMHRCFGEAVAKDKDERNFRFLEESLELVQAGGCTQEDAHKLVDYVYRRPVGELAQEVGGVSITLAALCQAHKVSWEASAVDEYKRINQPEVIVKIRQKQATKPQHSPLPGVTSRGEAYAAAQKALEASRPYDPLGDDPEFSAPISEETKALFQSRLKSIPSYATIVSTPTGEGRSVFEDFLKQVEVKPPYTFKSFPYQKAFLMDHAPLEEAMKQLRQMRAEGVKKVSLTMHGKVVGELDLG